MPVYILTLTLVLVVGLISNATGNDIVQTIKDRYNNIQEKCKDDNGNEKPAYECSGIMIRGVSSNQQLEFAWSMKARNIEKKSFSLAYLRSDHTFSRFPKHHDSGFIIYPHLNTPQNKNTYMMFCSFPVDGFTDYRNGRHACGETIGDTSGKSGHCDKLNIRSIENWKSNFINIANYPERKQCGFDMTIETAADDFAVNIKARSWLQSQRPSLRINELRMHAWSGKKVKKIPIEAFFYLIDTVRGKARAEKYQDDYYAKSNGEIVPIVGIRLPTATKSFEVIYHNRTPKNHK